MAAKSPVWVSDRDSDVVRTRERGVKVPRKLPNDHAPKLLAASNDEKYASTLTIAPTTVLLVMNGGCGGTRLLYGSATRWGATHSRDHPTQDRGAQPLSRNSPNHLLHLRALPAAKNTAQRYSPSVLGRLALQSRARLEVSISVMSAHSSKLGL